MIDLAVSKCDWLALVSMNKVTHDMVVKLLPSVAVE